MSTLEDDLKQYADEAFNKGDVKAGLKLIGEISGLITLNTSFYLSIDTSVNKKVFAESVVSEKTDDFNDFKKQL